MADAIPVLPDDQVEDAIWSYFWQLANKRDRRRTTIRECGEDGVELPKVNVATGLPESANDLTLPGLATSGMKLALGAIVPPERLAAAMIQVLPDGIEPTEVNYVRHGTVLALKSRTQWTLDEVRAVEANATKIKFLVERLARDHGWFDLRPINPKDPDMSDLVWEDEAGFTLGFRLTRDGWLHMEKLVEKRPHLKRVLHVLDFAGDEIRRQAPQWAQDEWAALRR